MAIRGGWPLQDGNGNYHLSATGLEGAYVVVASAATARAPLRRGRGMGWRTPFLALADTATTGPLRGGVAVVMANAV